MKIYFEDGVLTATQSLALGCDHIINAATGYSNNVSALDVIQNHNPNASIYTNSLAALSNVYCWNRALGVPELYLRAGKDKTFTRVDALTDKELHECHNLMALYQNGGFRK